MLPPLIFAPLYRRYLWGGRGFAGALGRDLPEGDDFAESWELVDRGADQSIVAHGPLAGTSLGDLVRRRGGELLGRHAPQPSFPLLFKFLDACRDLSVQVHPDDERAARLSPPDRGKTEAWYVVAADPRARVYAGLREGVDRDRFAAAVRGGHGADMLHSFTVRPGDCIFVPAGTVHAIGAGLLVAEIQQSSDVTYRLHDWGRTAADGTPRKLHVDAGLEAATETAPGSVVVPAATADPVITRLVACRSFVLDEARPDVAWEVGGDDACRFLAVISGRVRFEGRWELPDLTTGRCVLIPASAGRQRITVMADAGPARVLQVGLP